MTAPPSPSDRPIEDRFAAFFEEPTAPESPPPQNTEVSPTPTEPVEESAESEEVEASEVAPEPEEGLEAAPEEPTEPTAEEEPDGTEIRTDADIAEALGVELPDLHKHLEVKLGDETVTLGEALERAAASPTEQVAKLAASLTEHRTHLENLSANMLQEHQSNMAALTGLANFHLQKVEGDAGLSEAALAALRESDPEQWAVKSEERRQVFGQIDSLIRAGREAQQKFDQQQAQVAQQRAAEEGARLLQAIPEWSANPDQAMQEATEISGWIQKEFNFSQEEMGEMPDHRLALAFRRLYIAENKVAATEAKRKTLEGKKLKASKSVVPTRARRAKVDSEAQRLEGLRRVQRETAFDVRRRPENEAAAAARLARLME